MVDYVKQLGSQQGSKTMIRDLGTTVEFWVMSGSAGTYHFAMPFGWTVNGSTGTATIPYNYPWPGKDFPTPGPWLRVKVFTVTYSQTVTFRIGNTLTDGLNGPSDHSVYLNRSTRPSPPNKPVISDIGPTSVFVTFTDGSTGGSPITSRKIGYGTNPTSVQKEVASDKTTLITGLIPGTLYYFWANATNANGTSNWSPRAEARTVGVVHVKVGTVYKTAVPYVKVAGVWRMAQPWGRRSGVWKQTG